MYRIALVFAWWCTAVPAFAVLDRPKEVEPLPDRSQPFVQPRDSFPEPQVTINRQSAATFERYGLPGLKVTPKSGKPYYLQDDRDNGRLNHGDTLGQRLVVPRWNIFEFGRNS
jgi:uncharacterized protein DUF2782